MSLPRVGDIKKQSRKANANQGLNTQPPVVASDKHLHVQVGKKYVRHETEEPGVLQSMGLQRAGQDLVTERQGKSVILIGSSRASC